MDDQRNPQADTEQDVEAVDAISEAPIADRPRTMFDDNEDQATRDEMTRFARKRAAIWGLAAGGVMSLILVVCAVLIYLLGTS